MALLVSQGHSEAAIGDYPLDKLEMYVKAASRKVSRDREATVLDTLAAICGALSSERKSFDEYMRNFKT